MKEKNLTKEFMRKIDLIIHYTNNEKMNELKLSPRRILSKLSPRTNSAPSSLRSSPLRVSQTITPYLCQYYGCVDPKTRKPHKLKINGDLFLGIKCTCCPHKFFCSPMCHRSHIVDPSEPNCELYLFKEFDSLDSELTWDHNMYIHDIKEYGKEISREDIENEIITKIKEMDLDELNSIHMTITSHKRQ